MLTIVRQMWYNNIVVIMVGKKLNNGGKIVAKAKKLKIIPLGGLDEIGKI